MSFTVNIKEVKGTLDNIISSTIYNKAKENKEVNERELREIIIQLNQITKQKQELNTLEDAKILFNNVEEIVKLANDMEVVRKKLSYNLKFTKYSSIISLLGLGIAFFTSSILYPSLVLPFIGLAGLTALVGFLFKTVNDDKIKKESKNISSQMAKELLNETR